MIDMLKTGQRIKFYSEQKGFKTTTLAKKIGVTYQAIYKWEHGISVPSLDTLMILAKTLDCRLDDLVMEEVA